MRDLYHFSVATILALVLKGVLSLAKIGELLIPPHYGRKKTTSVFGMKDLFPGMIGRNQ